MTAYLGPTPYSGLSSAIKDTQAEATRYQGMQSSFIKDVENTGNERTRLGGSLSSQSALMNEAGASHTFAGTLSNSARVAKARQRIANTGDEAIRHQQFRDRVSIMRMANNQRGRGLTAMSNAANIREGVNLAQSDARANVNASTAGMLGSIAGGATAWWKDRQREPNVTYVQRGGT